ncbi:MAG: hypothetical protein M1814_003694 [Vezdaea aestivalis]|nr:MAG: hypothetical protein M1814_003694 [Vezdaea aestivalis]
MDSFDGTSTPFAWEVFDPARYTYITVSANPAAEETLDPPTATYFAMSGPLFAWEQVDPNSPFPRTNPHSTIYFSEQTINTVKEKFPRDPETYWSAFDGRDPENLAFVKFLGNQLPHNPVTMTPRPQGENEGTEAERAPQEPVVYDGCYTFRPADELVDEPSLTIPREGADPTEAEKARKKSESAFYGAAAYFMGAGLSDAEVCKRLGTTGEKEAAKLEEQKLRRRRRETREKRAAREAREGGVGGH